MTLNNITKRLMFLFCIAISMLVIVLQPTLVRAAPEAPGQSGEAFQVSKSDHNHGLPVVAHNTTSNQYFVVWTSHDENDPERDLYGQIMNDQAIPYMDPFLITTAAGSHGEPAVVYNATADEYMVAWTNLVGTETYLVGQHVASDGTLLDNPFTVSEDESLPDVNFKITDGNYPPYYPKLAYNSFRNEYLVIWLWLHPDGFGIYGQRFTFDGLPLGNSDSTDAFPIMTTLQSDYSSQEYPAVAYNSHDDEYLVVAHRQGGTADAGDITASAWTETEISWLLLAPLANHNLITASLSRMQKGIRQSRTSLIVRISINTWWFGRTHDPQIHMTAE